MTDREKPRYNRRAFIAFVAGLGVGCATTQTLWADDEQPQISLETVKQAEKLLGLEFNEAERKLLFDGVLEYIDNYRDLRQVKLANEVTPAWQFVPLADSLSDRATTPFAPPSIDMPRDEVDIAFLPISHLAALLKNRRITSARLTEIYLQRLQKHQSMLQCTVTFTEEMARREAEQADREIAAGNYRGPLHGIPYGLKDLFATKGYRTTWGARPYERQMLNSDATVVEKLRAAGAVLVAKLTTGALAWGDVWFGGKTRNPWNLNQGSSGSSAGPAAAVAAGLVGFAIGTETYGSIISPCTRCGTTGLRPSFGRVSRHGGMALSWTMDKVGPIARSVEDCALVFDAIHGPDGKDDTVFDRPFSWKPDISPETTTLGYVKSAFAGSNGGDNDSEWQKLDNAVLEQLRSQGFKLIAIELPDYPVAALSFILQAEAAAAFDELTRTNQDDLLVRQQRYAWPNTFRQARFIPAVEYIQANRIRTQIMREMQDLLHSVDAYICPSYGGDNLLLTNLTGHPSVVVPNGFASNGTPRSITFVGKMFDEATILAIAKNYQDANRFHQQRPPKFS